MRVARRAVIASRSDRAARPPGESAVDRSPALPETSLAASDDATRRSAAGRRRDVALPCAADFDRCLARPATLKSGAFALHVAPAGPERPDADRAVATPLHDRTEIRADIAGDAAVPVWRLGLVIPKRFEASAVARNTIKRRWRGAFRVGRIAWAHEFGSVDVVVRMHAPLLSKAERAERLAEPARVRARTTFDPGAAFVALAERLRSRGLRERPPAPRRARSA